MTTVERRSTAALLALLVVRLAAMAAIPLNESTEARYGEMARKMLETGNWVLPMHDYGIPFLAKPPLWAWMSAASMGIFGVNAFAARLPALLLSIMTLGLVWLLALKRHGRGASIGAAARPRGQCGVLRRRGHGHDRPRARLFDHAGARVVLARNPVRTKALGLDVLRRLRCWPACQGAGGARHRRAARVLLDPAAKGMGRTCGDGCRGSGDRC